jgi:hypothetical protein
MFGFSGVIAPENQNIYDFAGFSHGTGDDINGLSGQKT